MFSEDIEHTSYLHPDPNEFYPYTPVDPFRPSLAYSVQNVPDLEDVIDQLNLNAYSAPNFRPKIGRGLEQGFRELQRVTSDAGLSGPRTALGEDPLPYMRASHGEFPSEPPPHRRERTSSMRSNRSQTRGDEDDGFPRHRGSPLPDLRSTNSVKSKNSGNSLKGETPVSSRRSTPTRRQARLGSNLAGQRRTGSVQSTESIHPTRYIFALIFDTIPRQVYLHFLLRLPYLYFSRVTRIFQEAEMTMAEIMRMAHQAKKYRADPAGTRAGTGVEPARIVTSLNPQESLYKTWETFIDSLMREWKTLNIISVLLLTAILTILQIESAANDPVTRYSALLSMICAFMSLLFGCMYIIRFGSTMRTGQKAVQWAEEARSSTTGILWNIWVLLAMPATWLAWSMILYLVCIMSLVWRTGTTDDLKRGPMTPSDVLGPRIAISIVLLLGFVYFILITSTLRRYGDAMDRAWESRLNTILNEKIPETPHVSRSHAQETILVREPKPPLKRARSKTGGAAPESRIVAFNPQISFHSPDTPLEDERRTHDSDVSFESSDQNLSKEKHKAKQGKVSKRVELGDNEGLIKK